jgi:hypothetical protein
LLTETSHITTNAAMNASGLSTLPQGRDLLKYSTESPWRRQPYRFN